MKISDLLRLAKEIQRREGDIDVVYGTAFIRVEPNLKIRPVGEKKVLVIEEPENKR